MCPLPVDSENPICLHPVILTKIVLPTNFGAWGVAIVENFVFPHHAAPLCFLTALPPSNPSWEDAHPWEMLALAISPSG